MPITRPKRSSTRASGTDCTCKPVNVIPAPATSPAVAKRRWTSYVLASLFFFKRVSFLKAGSTRPIPRGRMKTRPRKTQRQPKKSEMIPASAGPINPGITQALASIATMRGFNCSGYPCPTQAYMTETRIPAPNPCTALLRMKTTIEGAVPARISPITNEATPIMKGSAGPRWSASSPASMRPTSVASM